MRCNALLLVLTMPYLLTSYVLDLCAAFVSTHLGFGTLGFLPGSERPPIRAHSSTVLRKSVRLVNTTVPLNGL